MFWKYSCPHWYAVLLPGLLLAAVTSAVLGDTALILYVCNIMSCVAVLFIMDCKGGSKNHWLYFHVMFWLMFIFGPTFSLLVVDDVYAPFQVATTFVNKMSTQSVDIAIVAALGFLLVNSLLLPFSSEPILRIPPNQSLAVFSIRLLAVAMPLALLYKLMSFQLVAYESVYTQKSPFLAAVANTIVYVGFFIFLASRPRFKIFIFFAFGYLLIHLFDVVIGYRGGILIFALMCFWYSRVAFDFQLSRLQYGMLLTLVVLFLFFIEIIRSSAEINMTLLVPFLASSISKGIYTTALYIDNAGIIDSVNQWTIFGPINFLFDYVVHGSAISANSAFAAEVRSDLNHVMSSTLNYSAYVRGAGLGSSFLAEMLQPGALYFLLFGLLFFGFYEAIFRLAYKSRPILVLSFFTFQHFIFTPRDSFFPFFWGYLKLGVLSLILILVYSAWRQFGKKQGGRL